MTTSTIGERIAHLRQRRGWTQAELVAGLPVSDSYISLIESGRRRPSERVLESLAGKLGCTVEYLLTGRGHEQGRSLELDLRFAELALRAGDVEVARDRFEEILDQAAALGSAYHPEACEALWGLSRARLALGELEAALRGFERLDEEPDLPVTVNRVALRMHLCRTYLECGDVSRAVEIGEAALHQVGVAEGAGDGADRVFVSEEATELASTLVLCYYERGDLTRAHLLARSVIDGAEDSGSSRARAAAYWNAALVCEARGDLRGARSLTERALALYGEAGNAWAVASLRVNCAWLLLRLPEPDVETADALLQRAIAELPQVGSPVADVASAETELARCRLLGGDPVEAEAIARTALARLTGGPHLEAARARAVLADALLAMGDDDAAVAAYTEAAAELEEAGASRHAAEVWRHLADSLVALGRTEEAIVAYRNAADAVGVPAVPGRPPASVRRSVSAARGACRTDRTPVR